MVLQMAGVRESHHILDLAGGTGDMAALFAPAVGAQGRVVLTDLNRPMMQVGRDRLLNQGISQVEFCQAPAEQLPFANDSFDSACISFGIRNFTDKDQSLAEVLRVLKPGAALLVLEFSTPTDPLQRPPTAPFRHFGRPSASCWLATLNPINIWWNLFACTLTKKP